jgi:hypothetical protein
MRIFIQLKKRNQLPPLVGLLRALISNEKILSENIQETFLNSNIFLDLPVNKNKQKTICPA